MTDAPRSYDAVRAAARRRLPRPIFDYVDGGADGEETLRANPEAFGTLRLVPRALVDVSQIDLSVALGGRPLALPVILAPAGLLGLVHPDGETAGPIAASRHGTLAIVSGHGTYSLEEVAAAQAEPGWFNMFPWGDRERYGEFVDRAAAAGYSGLCITLDTAVAGNRERDVANGFSVPPRLTANAFSYARHPRWVAGLVRHRRCTLRNFDPGRPPLARFARRAAARSASVVGSINRSFGWEDLQWIRSRWPGTLAVKGAVSSDDAVRMAECGVEVFLLGNHGGRQLDCLQASLEQLPAVAHALEGRAAVVLDGGVRRGTDVVKALCLGAAAVSIGRPWVFGLAAGGIDGAAAVLASFERELTTALTLLGAASVRELDSSFVKHEGLS